MQFASVHRGRSGAVRQSTQRRPDRSVSTAVRPPQARRRPLACMGSNSSSPALRSTPYESRLTAPSLASTSARRSDNQVSASGSASRPARYQMSPASIGRRCTSRTASPRRCRSRRPHLDRATDARGLRRCGCAGSQCLTRGPTVSIPARVRKLRLAIAGPHLLDLSLLISLVEFSGPHELAFASGLFLFADDDRHPSVSIMHLIGGFDAVFSISASHASDAFLHLRLRNWHRTLNARIITVLISTFTE